MQMPSAINNVASNLRQRVAGVMENLPGSLDELSTKANELLDKTPDAVRQGAKDLLANQQVAEGFKTMFGAGDSIALSTAATGGEVAAVATQSAETVATATKAAKGAKGAADAVKGAKGAVEAAKVAETAAAAVKTAESAATATTATAATAGEGAKGLFNAFKDKLSGLGSKLKGARWDNFTAGFKQILPGLGKALRSGAIVSAIFSGIGNIYMMMNGERSTRRAIGGVVSDTVGGAVGGVISALASGAAIAALGALGVVGWPVTLAAAGAGFLGFLGFDKLFKGSGLKDQLIHLFT
jgi:hypothetical protein